MHKVTAVAATALVALSLCACSGSATGGSQAASSAGSTQGATQAEASYTYEGIEEWDEPIPTADGKLTVHDVMDPMAKEGTDMDAFAHSVLGEYAISSSYLNNHIGDIADPAVDEYWAERGMVHEEHDVDDADRQWTSLVPADYDPSKTYPLLFVWHGNANPILLAEGYGFGEVAAEKDWIVVFPWAKNDDLYLSEFDRILEFMKQNYSIDTARVYTAGFSKGGFTSQLLALQRADVLAAAAPCGTTPGGGPSAQLRTDDFTNAQGAIPVQFFGGSLDTTGAMPYDVAYEINGLNGYLGLHGIEGHEQSLEQSEELISGAEDETERAIGATFDETETVEADGTTYHIGSYLNADGVATIKIVECEDAIHWCTPSMASMSVAFLEQFSK